MPAWEVWQPGRTYQVPVVRFVPRSLPEAGA